MIGLKSMEDSKNNPQISNSDGTWETNGALDQKKKKKKALFSVEKNGTEEVNACITHDSSPCYKIHSSNDL